MSDSQRINQLTVAAVFCIFDRNLRSGGKGSIIWGLLNVVLGVVLIAGNDLWGAVSLLLGLVLIAAGIYEMRVRDPKVIIVSASTLALLAVWNFGLIALAAMGKVQLALGGRTLFWALAQAWGAYATWKTYATYETLLQKSDPVTVQEVRGYLDEINRVKPQQTLDVAEFEANTGFVEGTKRYRLKPVENLYLVARYKQQFRSLRLEEITFIPRASVTLIPEGEKWMSNKIRATVQLGEVKIDKVSVTPEMATRINPAAQAIALGKG